MSNPGYDVYFVNPFPELGWFYYNNWWQGEDCHAGLMNVADNVFRNVGVDIDVRTLRMLPGATAFSNYFVGNGAFWRRYMEFTLPVYDFIRRLAAADARFHDLFFRHGTRYKEKESAAGFFPFIMERLLSMLLASDGGIRYLEYDTLTARRAQDALIDRFLAATQHHVRRIDALAAYSPESVHAINRIGWHYHEILWNNRPADLTPVTDALARLAGDGRT